MPFSVTAAILTSPKIQSSLNMRCRHVCYGEVRCEICDRVGTINRLASL